MRLADVSVQSRLSFVNIGALVTRMMARVFLHNVIAKRALGQEFKAAVLAALQRVRVLLLDVGPKHGTETKFVAAMLAFVAGLSGMSQPNMPLHLCPQSKLFSAMFASYLPLVFCTHMEFELARPPKILAAKLAIL